MACLSSGKMVMLMDILKSTSSPGSNGSGKWTWTQDSTSGAIERSWLDDDPNTPTVEGHVVKDVPCLARGILGTGIKGVGTTQSFDVIYQNIEWIRINVPADCGVTERDRITRIRDLSGNVIWKELDRDNDPATVFSVMGITPLPGAFGEVVELEIFAKRAEVQ